MKRPNWQSAGIGFCGRFVNLPYNCLCKLRHPNFCPNHAIDWIFAIIQKISPLAILIDWFYWQIFIVQTVQIPLVWIFFLPSEWTSLYVSELTLENYLLILSIVAIMAIALFVINLVVNAHNKKDEHEVISHEVLKENESK